MLYPEEEATHTNTPPYSRTKAEPLVTVVCVDVVVFVIVVVICVTVVVFQFYFSWTFILWLSFYLHIKNTVRLLARKYVKLTFNTFS